MDKRKYRLTLQMTDNDKQIVKELKEDFGINISQLIRNEIRKKHTKLIGENDA